MLSLRGNTCMHSIKTLILMIIIMLMHAYNYIMHCVIVLTTDTMLNQPKSSLLQIKKLTRLMSSYQYDSGKINNLSS